MRYTNRHFTLLTYLHQTPARRAQRVHRRKLRTDCAR